MQIRNIIVQAGGKGSRLETLTANKPKALVPVDNLPMIFHLFKKYPQANFHIIADYQKETFKRYLKVFADVSYSVIETDKKGTCSGINNALANIPDNEPFMIIWCDLVLSDIDTDSLELTKNYLGISKDFPCRWSYIDDTFKEQPSSENGVAGLFIFKSKAELSRLPDEGEFVRFLSTQPQTFSRINLYGGLEIGTMLSYFQNELNKPKCRPFNKIEIKDNKVIKTPLGTQGEKIAKNETDWYKFVKSRHFNYIPEIYQYEPLILERITGQNVYEFAFLTKGFKKALLNLIIEKLTELHQLADPIPAEHKDCRITYIEKTFDRLATVKELVPFAEKPTIRINGIECSNIFMLKDKITQDIENMFPEHFHLIHGDCTFHNIMIDSVKVRPIFIDPRGYFGDTKCYGDIDYDWAKLYYSLVGDYDQFNRKNFSLEIKENEIELEIVSNNWKELEDAFFEFTKADKKKILLLHALIWLSLTTYAWEDYDSICSAFCKRLLELQKYLDYYG